MNPFNYFIDVLKKYATFSGRARRSEYWYFILFSNLISFALLFLDGGLGTEFLSTIFSLGVLVPTIAVAVRRMHDVGKSGWFLLIPIYNLILAVTDSEPGTNEYGPNPKNPELDDMMDHLVE
jgi:uncharacterized membrane protein YhaH (DUF805 family)